MSSESVSRQASLSTPSPPTPTATLNSQLIYEPLNESREEIRLLHILLNSDTSSIRCRLSHVSLDVGASKPTYTALSYCWGSLSNPETVLIDGVEVPITCNLKLALDALQSKGHYVVWVDALCINQEDEVERAKQILRMKDIYSAARETVAWLGPDELGNAGSAFSHLNWVSANASEFETEGISVRPDLDPRWATTTVLLGLSYWRRTWIIQELSTSQSVILLWGSETLDFMHLEKSIRALRQEKKTRALARDYVQVFAITDIVWSARRRSRRDSLQLAKLLHLSCHSEATKLHDKIFGILGMCKDSETLLEHPSYTQSLENIVEEMTRNMLLDTNGKSQTRQGADIGILVFRPSEAIYHTDSRKKWPSWVIDWPTFWHHKDGYLWTSMTNCGLRSDYRVSGNSTPDVSFSEDGKVLRISGVLFDTVESLSGLPESSRQIEKENPPRTVRCSFDPDPDDALIELSKWDIDHHNVYGNEADIFNAIWRCLVMDRSIESKEPAPSSFGDCFGRIWSKGSAPKGMGDFEIYGRSLDDWAQKYACSSNSGDIQRSNDDMDKGLEAKVEAVVFGLTLGAYFSRRLMQTRKGFIGLAHAQSRVGDCICLLSGCEIPVILRRCEDGFTIVGAGYVQGIMDGIVWKQRHLYGTTRFQIR